jgi:hypothetical protein
MTTPKTVPALGEDRAMDENRPRLWRISGFDNGPHWDAAIVRARSESEARAVLLAALGTADQRPDTVWSPDPPDEWSVQPVSDDEPVVFLLGSGCRG